MEPRTVEEVLTRLGRIETAISDLAARDSVKEYYDSAEVARMLGKAKFTVREWCRLGRLNAEKRGSGRGPHQAWVVSHGEILRYQRDGLLPPSNR